MNNILKKIGLLSLLAHHVFIVPVIEMGSKNLTYNNYYDDDYDDDYAGQEIDCSKNCCPPSKSTVFLGFLGAVFTGALYAGLRDNNDHTHTCVSVTSDNAPQVNVYMKPLKHGDGKENYFSLHAGEKICVDGFYWKEIIASFSNSTENYPAHAPKKKGAVPGCGNRYLNFDADNKAWILKKCNKNDRRLDEKSSFSQVALNDIMTKEDQLRYKKDVTEYLRGNVDFNK